ncbi:DUF4214 domain-containing protein [Oxalobacteraceae bacterium OTU3CAMAD1]|nr:DUF4214 domain-containing protein [Oxalobacteraceae bacterium OTU3CAMAD1]
MATITGINSLDALLKSSWASSAGTAVTLTYSFLTTSPAGATTTDANGFKPMTAAQQAAVKVALDSWAAVADITFTQVSSGGDLQVGTNNQGDDSSAYAYLPGGRGPVYMYTNNTYAPGSTYAAGDFGASVLIHEFGHTLGLKHPGNYDSTGGATDGPFLPAATDNLDFTQMSYNTGSGFSLNGNYGVTPMQFDIQAIQYMYGANMAYHTGADTYSFVRDSALQCIWDAGGTDTLDFSACTGATIINLNQGNFSSTAPGYNNISIAYNVTIERAIAGSGGSTIHGNDAGNVIIGGIRSDTVYLGKGSDTVTGGGGGDTVVFDLALASYGFSGSKAALTVTGEGTDLLNNISTLKFDDRTIQLSNYISLSGGGAGDDKLVAGTGNELFSGGTGFDTVHYSLARSNYTVAASGKAFTVGDKSVSGGTDLVAGVERLEFSDGSGVALDIAGAAGQTYRLYQAAFNRKPDLGGLSFWLDKMDDGLGLASMAQFFLNSKESVAIYALLTDAQFVAQVYTNVLHREPDTGGLDFYIKGMAAGVTRAAVLADFSESAENQAAVIGSITNGINYTVF